MDQSGDVISHLNISSAGTEDGGLYACVASNTLATVEHKARLNIYGITLRILLFKVISGRCTLLFLLWIKKDRIYIILKLNTQI